MNFHKEAAKEAMPPLSAYRAFGLWQAVFALSVLKAPWDHISFFGLPVCLSSQWVAWSTALLHVYGDSHPFGRARLIPHP